MATVINRPVQPALRVGTRATSAPATGFDRGYWLAHCEGYTVETADGRLGIVEEVREAVLAIRAGFWGKRLLLVSATEVDFIVPRARGIWLRSPVSILGTEALP